MSRKDRFGAGDRAGDTGDWPSVEGDAAGASSTDQPVRSAPPAAVQDGPTDGRDAGEVAGAEDGAQDKREGGPPSKTGRFQPGRSGNPRGRPRKLPRVPLPSQNRRDVIAVMNELVPVKTQTGNVMMPPQLAIIRTAAIKAAKGDMAAIRLWRDWSTEAIDELHARFESMQIAEAFFNMVADPECKMDDRTIDVMVAALKRIQGSS